MPTAKLLLVEDDPSLCDLLEFRFRNEGYDVRSTADGDEALILAAEDVPDLVILDWMIEGTSGIEVCRRLRRDDDGRRWRSAAAGATRGRPAGAGPGRKRP